jgi:glycine cleavage system H lipoate-binding protein
MSKVPHDLRFLKSHEWARLETDGTVTVGISDHAQQALGDLVFVEAPEAGTPCRRRRGDRSRRIGQGRVRRVQPRER